MISLGIITFDPTISLSVVLVVFGALAFFFGKLIEEVKPTKEERTVTYISGTLFLMLYVILPMILIYSFRKYLIDFKINLFVVLLIQSSLFYILNMRMNMFHIEKGKKKKLADEEIKNQSARVMNSVGLGNRLNIDAAWIAKTLDIVFYRKLSSNVLIVISILYCWVTANVLFNNHHALISFYFFLHLIFGLSNIAILYGWSSVSYQDVKVVMDTGKEITGSLTKISDDFVTLIGANVLHHINKDKIRFIEKSMVIKKPDLPQIDNMVKTIEKLKRKK